MARALALVAALCTLAACGSSSAASSARIAGARCGPGKTRTLARSGQARVYARGHTVYGCSGSSRHPVRLGTAGFCPGGSSVGVVAVAGPLAAYAVRTCGVDTSSSQVIVRRLTDGRQLSRHPAYSGAAAPESIQSIGSIVVTSGGKAAWIASSDSLGTHRQSTEVVATSGSGVRVLDSSPGIAIGSLQLSHGTLSWMRGGARHTAPLP